MGMSSTCGMRATIVSWANASTDGEIIIIKRGSNLKGETSRDRYKNVFFICKRCLVMNNENEGFKFQSNSLFRHSNRIAVLKAKFLPILNTNLVMYMTEL